ncbi:MAG: hypothetical protein EA398_06135 [Deltaproteobacteria bacterium]|nr:MAG: hypothetical protein EA398_06135 [Deltaproteobacteria bacterium]
MYRKAIATFATTLVIVASVGTAASAQDDVDTAFFDFDDMLIDGDLLRPDGMQASTRQSATFESLLNIRRSFLPEIGEAAQEEGLR